MWRQIFHGPPVDANVMSVAMPIRPTRTLSQRTSFSASCTHPCRLATLNRLVNRDEHLKWALECVANSGKRGPSQLLGIKEPVPPSLSADPSTLGREGRQCHDSDHRCRHSHIDASLPLLGQSHPPNRDAGTQPRNMN